MKKTSLFLVVVLAAMAFSTAGCASAQSTQSKGDPFLGQWYDPPPNRETFTFNSDGTGTLEGVVMRTAYTHPLTWTASGDTLTVNITFDNDVQLVRVMTYSRSGDTLTWADSEGLMYIMHRPGKEPAPQQVAAQPPAQQPTTPPHPTLEPASANPEQPYTLVGSWYMTQTYTDGDGPDTWIYTFNSDGTGTFESREIRRNRPSAYRRGAMSAFRYTVSGNRLTITNLRDNTDNIISCTYNISGNTLNRTILAGGGTVQFTRAQPQQAPTTNQPPPIGTWSADVDWGPLTRITYTFNSNGTGTYREVINGRDKTSNLTWTIHEDWLRLDVNTGNNRNPVQANFYHYSISGNTLNLDEFPLTRQ